MRPGPDGGPLFRLPGSPGQPLPYLGYAPGAYLGQMVELILKQCGTAIHFDRVYETDMAEGLKAMALEGHGIAFLPMSAVSNELRAKKLVSALPPEIPALEMRLDIRAYRERPGARDKVKRSTEALWRHLTGHADKADHAHQADPAVQASTGA